ncbi:MAG: DUF1592 domain-containing protein [Phycisphaerales bacterium]|nr:DUF1592 domain-containing protein [Phycisphaerales bacterium]
MLQLALILASISSNSFVPASPLEDIEGIRPFMETWCIGCHEGRRSKADLDLVVMLDRIEAGELPAAIDRVIDRLDERDMPPSEEPRPGETEYDDVIHALESLLARRAERPPARTTIRRLGRYEYANTIRDLLGVELSIEDELPADEIGDGFDNSGDVLSVPPLLLEKYFDLAEMIASGAIADSDQVISTTERFSLDDLEATNRGVLRRSVWMLPTRGAVFARHAIPAAGPYLLRARVRAQQAGPDPVRMGLVVDGEILESFTVEGAVDDAIEIETEVDLDAGVRDVGVMFLNDYWNPEATEPADRDRNAFVEWVELEGPIRSVYPTKLQARLLDRHGSPDEPAALRAILGSLASLAWRRPVEPNDVDALLALSDGEEPGWDRVRTGLLAMLVHPRFLFRIEAEPAPGLAERRLDGWEIATRLSYFLWSTMPDGRLRRAAATGQLDTPEGRAREVRRMIRDPRSRNLARHFATQWLQIRSVKDAIPDDELFPGVDDRLLRLMSEETERFFDEILRKGLPVTDLIDGDWSWLNQPLAAHYGIEGVQGNRMRKVRIATEGEKGTGLLRHGSILVSTSNPTRTSPVKRGKWVLEALLDDAPPPPPPGISGLPDDGAVVGELTLREMLERHRSDPECASCHLQMDALGFALEPFDAVGRPRTEQGGMPIDALGELPDGRLVDGPTGLRDVLLDAIGLARFQRSLAMHLATYGLGRGLDLRDEAMLDRLVGALEETPTLERLILELVETDAFLLRPAPIEVIMEGEGTP